MRKTELKNLSDLRQIAKNIDTPGTQEYEESHTSAFKNSLSELREWMRNEWFNGENPDQILRCKQD